MKAQLRLHFLVLMWGFTGVIGKLITVSALPLVFLRVSIAAIAIMLYLKVIRVPLKVTPKKALILLGTGGIIGLHWIFFFGAIKVSNVSVVLSTLSTGALFTSFLEPLFFKRKIDKAQVIASLAVIVCLYFIFDTSPEQYTLGIAMGIFCSFLSALFTVVNAKVRENSLPTKVALYEMTGASLLVLIVLLFTGDIGVMMDISRNDWAWLILLGTLITAFPMIESVKLFQYLKPFDMLLAINLEPLYGILLAYLIFGETERMSPAFYIVALIMLLIIVSYEMRNVYLRKKRRKIAESEALK